MFVNDASKPNQIPQGEENHSTLSHDRRYLPRWEVNNKIIYHTLSDAAEHVCHSKDIHSAGACICTPDDVEPNQELELTIYLADDIEPVSVRGKTLWTIRQDNENLVGIQFSRVTQKTNDLIFNYAFEYHRKDIVNNWFKGL